MTFNNLREVSIISNDGLKLETVNNFNFIGSWVNTTAQDIKERKASAWRACNKLSIIWKSTLGVSRNDCSWQQLTPAVPALWK